MKIKFGIMGLTAMLALLLISGTVFAEGETPPAAPAADGEYAETVPAQAAPAPQPAAAEEISECASPSAEQETDILLVDDAGQALDLASQASAEKISNADPRWLVGTQWYSVVANESSCYPGTSVADNTCFVETDHFITFAINKMTDTGMPTDGKLFVEAGDYTEDVVIDSTRSLLNGLIGVDGSALTTINGNISITNNINGFTLSGFTIKGGVSILDSSGTLLLEDLNVKNPGGKGIIIGVRKIGRASCRERV